MLLPRIKMRVWSLNSLLKDNKFMFIKKIIYYNKFIFIGAPLNLFNAKYIS